MIRSTKWAQKSQGSPEILFSWACFNWFWKQAHWAQTSKPLRLFLYTSYQPLINDQRIIVWSRRPQEFWLSWESRNWENFQVCQKAKGKVIHVVVGEPLKKSSDISHLWIAIRRQKQRQSGREMLRGPRMQSGQAFLHHTQGLDVHVPFSWKARAHGLVGGRGPLHCISELTILDLISFPDIFFSF